MGEPFAIFFIFIAVMSISVLLFGGWVAVVSFKGITRLFSALMVGGTTISRQPNIGNTGCPRCRQANPPHARFCRRCGTRT